MTAEDGIPWARVERKLQNAEVYWLATVRPDGAPHSRPVWGVWFEGALWFGTNTTSVKGQALAADPRASVHLESGDDVVIVEGTMTQLPFREHPTLPLLSAKYHMPAEQMADGNASPALYRLEPLVIHAWFEGLFLTSRASWNGVPTIAPPKA